MESMGAEPEKPLNIWYQNRRRAKAYKKREVKEKCTTINW